MEIQFWLKFLGWTFVLHTALMLIWVLLVTTMKGTIRKVHSRIFGVSEEIVSTTIYRLLLTYKILLIFFILIPYLVLRFFFV